LNIIEYINKRVQKDIKNEIMKINFIEILTFLITKEIVNLNILEILENLNIFEKDNKIINYLLGKARKYFKNFDYFQNFLISKDLNIIEFSNLKFSSFYELGHYYLFIFENNFIKNGNLYILKKEEYLNKSKEYFEKCIDMNSKYQLESLNMMGYINSKIDVILKIKIRKILTCQLNISKNQLKFLKKWKKIKKLMIYYYHIII
jgi:hypothetical protein